MRQVLIKKGTVGIYEVNPPLVKKGFIKIKVLYSTISVGTEISAVKGTEKSIFNRAIENPSKILEMLEVVKSQGIKSAHNKVQSVSEKLSSLGYSVAGEVIEIGENCNEFKIGDLVSAGGSGFAMHAEVIIVPKNLVVKIPKGLPLAEASTGTVGSIALHGVRRADLRVGEYAVVFGLGLIGLITLQILKASGVKVACVDIDNDRLNIAEELNADLIVNSAEEDPVNIIRNWTDSHGADAILFTASTAKDEPLSQSFRMCRRRGRVVLVGVSGMKINRSDIYRDEIDFMISTSYGPGRYDDKYELKGEDYPYAYVRWTENRNIQAYLNLLNERKINLDKLIPKIYSIDGVKLAYENVKNDPKSHILTILAFSPIESIPTPITVNKTLKHFKNRITIGMIGTGSFAVNTLLPIIYKHTDKFYLKSVFNSTGEKALNAAIQFKANCVVTKKEDIFNDSEIDLVIISTRHNSHTLLALEALKNNKHVFLEKPLAINLEELEMIERFYKEDRSIEKPILTVGYNRRFSKCITEIKSVLTNRISPMMIHYRMNAGFVPYDSWIHEDGGRIVGEACHIIDLMGYLTNSKITEYAVTAISPTKGRFAASDNRSISLIFNDGSVGVLDYFSCGNSNLPKEYMEIHFDNKSIIMNDYKELYGYGVKLKNMKSHLSNKGHETEFISLYEKLRKGVWPIPLDSLIHTSHISCIIS